MYIFTNPLTRSIFRQNLTGLNSETGCLTEDKKISLPDYLFIAEGLLCYVKCNHPDSGFEPVSPCPFLTTIAITPRAPPFYVSVRYFEDFVGYHIVCRFGS